MKTLYTGWLFVPTRKTIRYSMNNDGIKLEQVVHTHRAEAVGREGSQSSLLNITFVSVGFSLLSYLLGTLSKEDDDCSTNDGKKMNLRSFKLNGVYLDPLNMSNAGDFSWSRILKDFIQAQKDKGKFVVVCPRAVDVTEMY